MYPVLAPIPFEITMFVVRITGMRDRLRCPECKAVGTFKPHDGIVDNIWCRAEQSVGKGIKTSFAPRGVRRWLCKWCGHYVGPEGHLDAWPDPERGVWVLPAPHDPESGEPGMTPDDVLAEHMSVWPWRG